MREVYLDTGVYKQVLSALNNLHMTDKSGHSTDLYFLSEDSWLRDTAVIENIVRRKGLWEIHLVFAHAPNPFRFIKRIISRSFNKDKATISGQYMRRLAAKDQRGTVRVSLKSFSICNN